MTSSLDGSGECTSRAGSAGIDEYRFTMSTVAVVSFRLGMADGVSVESAKWCGALRELGHAVRTVAGEGTVDVTVPGLALGATSPPDPVELARRARRRRLRHRRERLLPPAQRRCRVRRHRSSARGASGDPAPPRPAVAARRTSAHHVGPPDGPVVAARDDQRAVPRRAGAQRHRGDGDPQPLRPRPTEGRPSGAARRARRRRRPPRRPPRAGDPAQERRGCAPAGRAPRRDRTGSSAAPRTASVPSSTGCSRPRAPRRSTQGSHRASTSPTSTPRPTWSCSRRPGRASATPPIESVAYRRPLARTRLPASWTRSSATGCASSTSTRSRPSTRSSTAPDEDLLDDNLAIARKVYDLSLLPGAPRARPARGCSEHPPIGSRALW